MFRAPRPAGLPHLHTMLDDLPPAPDVARYLGISTSTLARYVRAGHAPRPVMLALFWETRWGLSAANCAAANAAMVHAQHARALRDQNAKLHRVIARLESELDTAGGAANAPFYLVG